MPCQHDVVRLEIAVKYAGTVRLGQRVGNLRSITCGFGQRQRPAFNACGQRLALNQLHYEIARPHIEQRADVWVI